MKDGDQFKNIALLVRRNQAGANERHHRAGRRMVSPWIKVTEVDGTDPKLSPDQDWSLIDNGTKVQGGRGDCDFIKVLAYLEENHDPFDLRKLRTKAASGELEALVDLMNRLSLRARRFSRLYRGEPEATYMDALTPTPPQSPVRGQTDTPEVLDRFIWGELANRLDDYLNNEYFKKTDTVSNTFKYDPMDDTSAVIRNLYKKHRQRIECFITEMPSSNLAWSIWSYAASNQDNSTNKAFLDSVVFLPSTGNGILYGSLPRLSKIATQAGSWKFVMQLSEEWLDVATVGMCQTIGRSGPPQSSGEYFEAFYSIIIENYVDACIHLKQFDKLVDYLRIIKSTQNNNKIYNHIINKITNPEYRNTILKELDASHSFNPLPEYFHRPILFFKNQDYIPSDRIEVRRLKASTNTGPWNSFLEWKDSIPHWAIIAMNGRKLAEGYHAPSRTELESILDSLHLFSVTTMYQEFNRAYPEHAEGQIALACWTLETFANQPNQHPSILSTDAAQALSILGKFPIYYVINSIHRSGLAFFTRTTWRYPNNDAIRDYYYRIIPSLETCLLETPKNKDIWVFAYYTGCSLKSNFFLNAINQHQYDFDLIANTVCSDYVLSSILMGSSTPELKQNLAESLKHLWNIIITNQNSPELWQTAAPRIGNISLTLGCLDISDQLLEAWDRSGVPSQKMESLRRLVEERRAKSPAVTGK